MRWRFINDRAVGEAAGAEAEGKHGGEGRRSRRFGASPSQTRTLGEPGTGTAATATLGRRRRPRLARSSSTWMKDTGRMQENW
jgi:hypothetical protein